MRTPVVLGVWALVAMLAATATARAQTGGEFPRAFQHEATRVQGVGDTPAAGGVAAAGASGGTDGGEVHGDDWSLESQGLAEVMPKLLQREVFEEVLRVNFFGTYLFYSRLDEEDRRAVYEAYTQNGTIDAVRDDVMTRSRLRHKLK